jgi:hypothetical protein
MSSGQRNPSYCGGRGALIVKGPACRGLMSRNGCGGAVVAPGWRERGDKYLTDYWFKGEDMCSQRFRRQRRAPHAFGKSIFKTTEDETASTWFSLFKMSGYCVSVCVCVCACVCVCVCDRDVRVCLSLCPSQRRAVLFTSLHFTFPSIWKP